MDDASDLTPAAALARADELKAAVDERSRWLIRFQLGYGAMSLVMVLLLGLISWPAGIVVSMAFWVVTLTYLIIYAMRQPVTHRGMARSHGAMMAAWTVLYMAVLFAGLHFQGEAAWWVPGAVVVSLPGFFSAYLTHRRTSETDRGTAR
ncbi:hypothetical protein J4573_37925 [Actinomadura barringtoniae]|uniref:Uncharacterized protein n=1 Tax=Actinomadura barringtoniae TaxID=1427535 RepID=A0A939PHR0_9ACTN|nr:hypothetical protein [Actinomadura barringtoniae]MBO2452921.1 hypothetical protein [Actinomadura barringtoniae]